MLTTVALALVLHSGPAQNPASQLISKMLRLYSSADSMTGTITLTASDGAGKVQVVTTLNYQKPSLLYILQKKMGGTPQQWLTISNGTWFSYDKPENLAGGETRVTESVKQVVPGPPTRDDKGNKQVKYQNYDIRQIYAIGAPTLGDRSVPLDIAIGRREDLEHDNASWITTQLQGSTTINGTQASLVTGRWRPYGEGRLYTNFKSDAATYEMAITEDGQLLRYSVFQPIENGPTISMVWDVDLKVNGKPDPKIFSGKAK